jgi:hypothetical protein
MNEVQHTPGPWLQSHREKPDGMWATEVYDAAGETIATMAWYPVKTERGSFVTARESNARLIAAAPELLEALEESAEELQFVLEKLGFSGYGDGQGHKAGTGDGIGSGGALIRARAAIAKATASESGAV